MSAAFLERLGRRIAATGSVLCVGVDPDPATLPAGFPPDVQGVEAFAALILDAALPYAAAVKPNLAFFEAFGSEGLAALERIRSRVPADVPFIADAKRGDIGSTAARQAVALFDALGADAVTASPYLGATAIAPLLEREDRFVYVLCRTSNPGAAELQNLEVASDAASGTPAEPLFLRVARRAATWHERYGTVGLVVGATAPRELEQVRATVPGLAFLVPGVGAQGGDTDVTLRAGPARSGLAGTQRGGAVLVNVARGIASAAQGATDPALALADAARVWAERLRVLESEPHPDGST